MSLCFNVRKNININVRVHNEKYTCTNVYVKPVQNGTNISFCILVSDKNTHDLATYIHLSKWPLKVHTTQY